MPLQFPRAALADQLKQVAATPPKGCACRKVETCASSAVCAVCYCLRLSNTLRKVQVMMVRKEKEGGHDRVRDHVHYHDHFLDLVHDQHHVHQVQSHHLAQILWIEFVQC